MATWVTHVHEPELHLPAQEWELDPVQGEDEVPTTRPPYQSTPVPQSRTTTQTHA